MATTAQENARGQMIVDGKSVDAGDGRLIDIENPANGTVIGQIPRGTEVDVEALHGRRRRRSRAGAPSRHASTGAC